PPTRRGVGPRAREGEGGGAVVAGAPPRRGGPPRPPARGRRRGPPLGRAASARPARVPRRLLVGRRDLRGLPRPRRAVRDAAVVDRPQRVPRGRPARRPRRRRGTTAGELGRRGRAGRGRRGPDPADGRGPSALPPAAAPP